MRTKHEIFLSTRCVPIPESGCFFWIGPLDRDGYGKTKFNRKDVRPHRIAYEGKYGAIPAGKYVLHRCDIRCCCNPAHLFLGDAKTNAEDAAKKGRNSRGTRNGMSKLNDSAIVEIRRDTRSDTVIARERGVDPALITRIKKRIIWKHV